MLILLEDKIATPLGELVILCDEMYRLRGVEWAEFMPRMVKHLENHGRLEDIQRRRSVNPGQLSDKLQDYFAGDLQTISKLTTYAPGTDFQQQVWQALRQIPIGTAISYGQLAEQLGKPGAARAVGTANGANPISIVVPCHRVIGANDTLTGYAGGIARKKWLLEHEGVLSAELPL